MTNDEICDLLKISNAELLTARKSQILPRAKSSPEEIIKHLFAKANTTTGKMAKIEEEVRKLRLQNRKSEGNLVDRKKVDEYIKDIFISFNSSMRALSFQILSNIVADPIHKETNKQIIDNQCRRVLDILKEIDESVQSP